MVHLVVLVAAAALVSGCGSQALPSHEADAHVDARALEELPTESAGREDGDGPAPSDASMDVAVDLPVDGPTDGGLEAPSKPDAPDPPWPTPPRLRSPWNGAATGSALVPASLRPHFRWTPVVDAGRYEIQIDDSCPVDGYRSCAFPSPEASSASLTVPTFESPDELPVSKLPPVGRRYFWRVRGCNDSDCTEWSTVRYLEVGRQAKDFDGDGYADVIVGSPGSAGGGLATLLLGGPKAGSTALGIPAPSGAIWFGGSVAFAGDVNADGFADVLVAGEPQVRLFLGGSSLDVEADLTLTGTASTSFGRSIAGTGDLDADGFADFVVGAPAQLSSTDAGTAFVYFGGPAMDATADLEIKGEVAEDRFGLSVAAAGDVDGDGFGDLVVGAPFYGGVGKLIGRAYLFLGGDPPDSKPDLSPKGDSSGSYQGTSVSSGDLDGDGDADLVVGAPASLTTAGGRARVYLGGFGLDETKDLEMTGGKYLDEFGFAVRGAGDLNGDGFEDVLVSSQMSDVRVFFGGWPIDAKADLTMTGETPASGGAAGFGSIAGAGDVNGDGWPDIAVGANWHGMGVGRVYVYFGGPALSAKPDLVIDGKGSGARFGVSVD